MTLNLSNFIRKPTKNNRTVFSRAAKILELIRQQP
jgi:hypothetical protein